MSYAHNRKKKNQRQFASKICKTFEEFCETRQRPNPITMTKEQYDQEMYLWLNYKKFYDLEFTLKEKAWAANHVNENKENENEC